MTDSKPMTAEEFAAILWPGMFQAGWRDQDPASAFFQAECYCLQKAEGMLKAIEVRRKPLTPRSPAESTGS